MSDDDSMSKNGRVRENSGSSDEQMVRKSQNGVDARKMRKREASWRNAHAATALVSIMHCASPTQTVMFVMAGNSTAGVFNQEADAFNT